MSEEKIVIDSSVLTDLWKPSFNSRGQYLSQKFGAMWYDPCSERSLDELLDRIEDKYQNEIQSLQDLLAKSEELLEEKQERIAELERGTFQT